MKSKDWEKRLKHIQKHLVKLIFSINFVEVTIQPLYDVDINDRFESKHENFKDYSVFD